MSAHAEWCEIDVDRCTCASCDCPQCHGTECGCPSCVRALVEGWTHCAHAPEPIEPEEGTR